MTSKFMKIMFIVGVVFLTATGFTSKKELAASNVNNSKVNENLELYHTVLSLSDIEEDKEEFSLLLGKSFTGFKEAVGFKESQGR